MSKYFYTVHYSCGHTDIEPTAISVFNGEEHIQNRDCPECLKNTLSRINLDALKNEFLEVCV